MNNVVLPRYVKADGAPEMLSGLAEDFALIHHPGHGYPPYELCPLPPRTFTLGRGLEAVFMDMDGTTTTTEDLCLNALEYMVRRMSGWETKEQWSGLDAETDFEHIIGYSCSLNVEYLLRKYGARFQATHMLPALIESLAWHRAHDSSPERSAQFQTDIAALNIAGLFEDPDFTSYCGTTATEHTFNPAPLARLSERWRDAVPWERKGTLARIGLYLYYHRLHGMFHRIASGRQAEVAMEVFGSEATHPIHPLPGVAFTHALLKGWLGADASGGHSLLKPPDRFHARPAVRGHDLGALGRYFERYPARVALVTSSTRFEAGIVLREVFSVLREEVGTWGLPPAKCERILEGFASPETFYDLQITASDAHEMRLKPHRDLYSVALEGLGLSQEAFDRVVGFEDTEAGVVAMRSAGITLSCAVPFAGTMSHDFRAASHVVPGGLPDVVLEHGFFLPESLLH